MTDEKKNCPPRKITVKVGDVPMTYSGKDQYGKSKTETVYVTPETVAIMRKVLQ